MNLSVKRPPLHEPEGFISFSSSLLSMKIGDEDDDEDERNVGSQCMCATR